LWSLYDDHTNPIRVYRLDAGNGSVISSFQYSEAPVHGEPGLAADARYIYGAHGSPDHIHTWTHTGTLLNTIPLSYYYRGLAWDGTYFWCGETPGLLCKVTTAGSVAATFAVGFTIYDLGWDGNFFMVTALGTLYAVTPTGSVVKTVTPRAYLGCDWRGGYIRVGGAYIYKLGWENLVRVRPASFGKINAAFR